MIYNIYNQNIYKEILTNTSMNKWLEIILGLILIIAAVSAWIGNFLEMGEAALIFLKGGIIWILIIVGILFLLLGISDLKE